ncbi:MAG: DNA polymerase III subunit alpha [Thermomicrobiales bacterium]
MSRSRTTVSRSTIRLTGPRSIGTRLDLPLVAANDVHYLNQDDAAIQELLICIQTNRTLDDPNRMKMSSDQMYFKSPDEMHKLFGHLPGAMENTLAIAERCGFDLDFGRLNLPKPDIPGDLTPQEYLKQLCQEGLRTRYGDISDEIQRRLDYELHVIQETGFPEYMLIVRDFAQYARANNIPMGVRGSAAASIVLYTLGITDIDPIENRLVFERFLNLERREMPDIDLDFADNRRQEMIDYAAAKYGQDRVAQIITFGTMGAKAAIRDVARASGWSHGDADRIARMIPSVLNMTLDRALEESPDLNQLYSDDPQVATLVNRAKRLEGISRHAGTHAAGIVISRDPLIDHVPLQRAPRSSEGDGTLPTTQFPMETVGEIGLLKMDFLGLSNLTILGEAVDIIREQRGVDLDPLTLPDGDEPTYKMLSQGETFGVFQLESAGMRRYIKELRPGSVSELAAMVALYRPGPMQHIPSYCKAKHGDEEIQYPHADLAEILDETYGVIVYQDQVLLIAQQFAGYTLGEADIMRKAMGKKIVEKMAAERVRFIEGANERGYSTEDAERIFNLIEPFAGYAFNKAHAVCYGTISYQTAYLKANYPAEYMTAVLRLAQNHPTGPQARIAAAVNECIKLDIPILQPDVNTSGVRFEVQELDDGARAIRFGLADIKNVGEAAIESLVRAREDKPSGLFESLYDLCVSVDAKSLNKRVLESLIKSGACDAFGDRASMLSSLDRIIAAAQQEQKASERGQIGLFGEMVDGPEIAIGLDEDVVAIPKKTLLGWEKEHVGIYLTENPLNDIQKLARRRGLTFESVSDLDGESVGQNTRLLCLVTAVRRIVTRTNRSMAIMTVEDLGGSIECVVFPSTFDRVSEHLFEDRAVLIKGKVDERNDSIQIVVDEIETITDDEQPDVALTPPESKRVVVRLEDVSWSRLQRLSTLISTFHGDDEIILIFELGSETKALKVGNRVDWCADLENAVAECLGTTTPTRTIAAAEDVLVAFQPG